MKAHKLPLLGLLIFVAAAPLPAKAYWTCELFPSALAVDPSLSGNSDGNGLLEPGETVDVEPSWLSRPVCHQDYDRYGRCPPFAPGHCPTTLTETGWVSPTSGDHLFLDREARYDVAFSPRSCASNQNCYSLFVPVIFQRRARHWDASFHEILSGTRSATKTWKVHVGDSFADVPRTHSFYKPIETLFHNGVTTGCTQQDFCPGGVVTRSEAAILLARALSGGGTNIPVSGSVTNQPYACAVGGKSLFDDVAPTEPLCRHAHYLASRNIMKPCRPSSFCPAETIPRVVMAVFVARAMVVPSDDNAFPPCNPASPDSHFADVPDSNDFCKFVTYLAARGVVSGCGPNQFCPADLVTRDQMAKFLVKAFALKL